ncbi:MAG: M56 family metallopeptidase [Pirellulales bacterium]|nr:M56 family metallopeptidase [Pirellulales bacterium]
MTELLTSRAGWLLGWLADYYLLATLFLAALLLARQWIRQPAHRLTLAWVVSVELIVLAVICALPFWPRISLVGVLTPEATPAAVDSNNPTPPMTGTLRLQRLPQPAPHNTSTEKSTEATPSPVALAAAEPKPVEPLDWIGLGAKAYLFGIAGVGLWLAWGVLGSVRILLAARPACRVLQDQLARLTTDESRPPRLLVSPRLSGAVAMGVLRPAILLPQHWTESPSLSSSTIPKDLQAVLAHEWAHIRHRDLWLLALGRVVLVLLFAHPLLWWLRRAIREDQELRADAVAAGESRHSYAQTLLDLIRANPGRATVHASAALAIWETPSQLTRRIAMLLDDTIHIHPTGSRTWRRRALGLMVLLGLGVSLLTLQPSRSTGEPTPTNEKPAAAPEKKAKKTGETNVASGRLVIVGDMAVAPRDAKKDKDKKDSKDLKKERHGTLTVWSTTTFSFSDDEVEQGVYLLGFETLHESAVLKQLKITDEQKKRLIEIQKQQMEDTLAFRKQFQPKKGRPSKADVLAERRWLRDQEQKNRKGLEKVLDAAQMKTLDEMALCRDLYLQLNTPPFLEFLALTPTQRKQLEEIQREMGREGMTHEKKLMSEALGVLNPEQRKKIRDLALDPLGTGPFMNAYIDSDSDEGIALFVPMGHPYPELGESDVQKRLKLTDAQRKRIGEILGDSPTLEARMIVEAQRLTPEQRKQAQLEGHGTLTLSGSGTNEAAKDEKPDVKEIMRRHREEMRLRREKNPLWKKLIELRGQMEKVLTPKQLDAYKDMAFQMAGAYSFRDPYVQLELGLNDQQTTALKRLFRDSDARIARFPREIGKKIFDVLTPAQKENLQEKLSKAQDKMVEEAAARQADGKVEGSVSGDFHLFGTFTDPPPAPTKDAKKPE